MLLTSPTARYNSRFRQPLSPLTMAPVLPSPTSTRHATASDAATSSPRYTVALRPGLRPWLLVGYLNIARYTEDRNNDNFDVPAAASLNELIDELALQELPLLDHRYTWTNSRDIPTLVQLDRAFINLGWGSRLFNSSLHPLIRTTSDHVPLLLSASSRAPKSQIFRYEKAWAFAPDYRALVASVWVQPQNRLPPRASLRLCNCNALKWVRAESKRWAKQRRRPAEVVSNCRRVLELLDLVEEL
jgi:hypothetical protein